MVRCRSKNGHQEGILCLKEIGLRAAQNFLTIIGSIIQGGEKGGGGNLCGFLMMAHCQWT